MKYLDGFIPYDENDAAKYTRLRWWPGLTLGDLLDKAADVYPGRVGFADRRYHVTYEEARARADKLAISLLELGIRPLDRVLVQLPNWTEFVSGYFALQKIGAVPVLLITRFRQFEIKNLAELSGARAWMVPERMGKYDFVPIIEEVCAGLPRLEHVIVARGEGRTPHTTFEQLIAAGHRSPSNLERLAGLRPDPRQVAHMGPTGGSTGLPKLVPRSHEAMICNAEYSGRAWDYNQSDVCLLAGPMGHDLTVTKGFLSGLFGFARQVLQSSTDMGDICRTIERERVSAIVWVPTLARRLVNYEHLADFDLSSLKKMHCGGGASAPDLIREVREKLHCTYYNAYGGSEGQTCITRTEDDAHTVGYTVGKKACPYDTYRIVGPDGREQQAGSPGELRIKGPGVFTGYFNNPAENATAFDEDGFFKTGDVARIDRQGYITLTGRIKEMINRGGESISAVEIENLISGHPKVALVAVVPMPDADMGEKVCAYVQPAAGCSLGLEELVAFLKECNASVLQFPERLEVMDCLPCTKAEKIDKLALRRDIEQKIMIVS